jgi:DNA ligase-1
MSEPQLAKDAILDKLPYKEGVLGLPKIDGVRAMNMKGTLTGRSLDPFEGFGITEFFSRPEFTHLDGEMTLGSNPMADALCRDTSGAMGRFNGVTEMADLHWWVFDHLEHLGASYGLRHHSALKVVERLQHPRIHIVPATLVKDKDHAVELLDGWLDMNYEGAIWRAASKGAKPGRPDKYQQYMRSKPWIDSEMLCTGFTEGEKNTNEAKKNTLGRTERSSAKAGKVPNGEVGSLQGVLLQDIFHPYSGKLLLPKDLPVTISTGKMTTAQAKHYFLHPDEIVNHVIKFKHLAHGVKDNPRMGQYLSHRLRQDM